MVVQLTGRKKAEFGQPNPAFLANALCVTVSPLDLAHHANLRRIVRYTPNKVHGKLAIWSRYSVRIPPDKVHDKLVIKGPYSVAVADKSGPSLNNNDTQRSGSITIQHSQD